MHMLLRSTGHLILSTGHVVWMHLSSCSDALAVWFICTGQLVQMLWPAVSEAGHLALIHLHQVQRHWSSWSNALANLLVFRCRGQLKLVG